MVSITVYDEAVAYGRMIPVRMGKHVTMVKPPKQREYQDWVRHVAFDSYHEQMGQDAPLLDEALVLSVRVYRQIPQSFSKRKAALAAEGLVMPTSKPDLDNYIKLVLDGMTGVVWKDGSQHSRLSVNVTGVRVHARAQQTAGQQPASQGQPGQTQTGKKGVAPGPLNGPVTDADNFKDDDIPF